MLARLKKIWSYIQYFFRAQKSWAWPRQSPVLIFDACNQGVLMEYLQPWSPEVLHVRGERINIRVLLSSFFQRGKKSDAYVDRFIDRVRPRLIVTFIDNNLCFFRIRQRHPEVRTLFIQNGWKSYYADIFEVFDRMEVSERGKLSVDYIMSFGVISGAEYARHIKGSIVSMGSIKNNASERHRTPKSDTVAFVSQWHKDGFYMGGKFYSQEMFFEQADRLILLCLAQYAKEKNKRLMIIPRNPLRSDYRPYEDAYFKKILGHEPDYFDPREFPSSYQAVDAADVVVAVDTTLGYESIARGKKTAIFSIRSHLLGIHGLTYGWPGDFPEEGPFWTNCPDPGAFARILDYLFEVDEARWRKDVDETCFSALMAFNPGNSILQSILEKELGSPISMN